MAQTNQETEWELPFLQNGVFALFQKTRWQRNPRFREGWRGPLWQMNLMSWRSLKWKVFFRRWKEVVLSSLQHVGWRACEMWQHFFFEYCVEPSLFGVVLCLSEATPSFHTVSKTGVGLKRWKTFFLVQGVQGMRGNMPQIKVVLYHALLVWWILHFLCFSHLSDDLQQVLNCHSNMPKSPRKEIGWLGGAIQDEQNVCHPATQSGSMEKFSQFHLGNVRKQMDGLSEFGNVFFSLCVCVVCVAHQIVDKKHQKVLFLGRLALLRWICAVQCSAGCLPLQSQMRRATSSCYSLDPEPPKFETFFAIIFAFKSLSFFTSIGVFSKKRTSGRIGYVFFMGSAIPTKQSVCVSWTQLCTASRKIMSFQFDRSLVADLAVFVLTGASSGHFVIPLGLRYVTVTI